MHILLTGGCGYSGSVLTEKLLAAGFDVTVVDAQWFGNALKPHPRLVVIRGDLRNMENIPFNGVDTVINLANVANDLCADLDPVLSWEVNVLATMHLAEKAVRSGVKQFIHASSGSVYGISNAERVTEDIELKPISIYNRTKMAAERILLSYKDYLLMQIIRPGTICGVSPRMRFDLIVNMFTMQALTRGEITVMGGDKKRPAVHVDDIADAYLFCLANGRVVQGIYNVAFENISIQEIAALVQKHLPGTRLTETASNDPRSYRMCSEKIIAAGFHPKKGVEHAIIETIAAYKQGQLADHDRCHNIRWMKQHPPSL